MTIILVEHETQRPALDAMIAGEMAALSGARLTPLVAGGAGLSWFDCVGHVLAHGELAPNGMLWAERAGGTPVGPPVQHGFVARLQEPVVLVPINPAILAQSEAAVRIRQSAARLGRPVEHHVVTEEGGVFRALSSARGRQTPAEWRRDAYGRPFRPGTQTQRPAEAAVRILLVGDEDHLRDGYPANLAALGDAADALGLRIDLRFLDPRGPFEPSAASALVEVDGILLPGGSDMEQVEGQIELARAAIGKDVPTLGLCLGMQSMVTAVAREIAGCNDANLAEVDPGAQTKTFVRLHDGEGRPEFRLGVRKSRVLPGTRFAAAMDGAAEIDVHYNHRFVLDPLLRPSLSAVGLKVCGLQSGRDLADAVELPDLRFFVGMQGHPELASRPGSPHPLIRAFLASAAGR